jgi:DNA polymerase-3 subunit epsilon
MTNVAIIDIETTGLNPYRHDRIVELAALVIRPDGEIIRQFVSLVNPERDIGPIRVHGLSTQDILAAPRFSEITGALIEVLDGCVALVGHNIRFDHSFLTAEFDRLGYIFPDGPTLCTMQLVGGGSLTCACSDYGIMREGEAHTAWHDARATAHLLTALLKDAPHLVSKISSLPPINWPNIPKSTVKPLTRDESRSRNLKPPTYLRRLLERVQNDIPPDDQNSSLLAYTALLDRVLEDRQVSDEEGSALVELATNWAITGDQIQKANSDYLLRLGIAAFTDGDMTDSEHRDLQLVASLLGIDSRNLNEILEMAEHKLKEVKTLPSTVGSMGNEQLVGKRVCFTGENQCLLKGEAITREMATELAARHGMIVAESVTKKLDILVVSDPLTQSGKAKKARRYGIRIMHEPVFWRALGLEVG